MADGLSQPPASASGGRRGPPPLPRGAVDSQPSLLSPSAESAVDELLALIAAEAESHADALSEKAEKGEKKKGSAVSDADAKAKKRAADLKVRAALLAWDGRGDVQKALAFVDKVDHPLVPAIKLAAAIELKDDAMLQACIAETKKRGDKADLAELGALLLWRARDAAHAAEVLALAGDEGKVARRLALALAGSWAPLVKAVGPAETAEVDLDALAEAAQTAQDRLGDANAARAMLSRAFQAAKSEGSDMLPYLVERLLELDDSNVAEVYRFKLSTLDGEGGAGAERGATQFLLAAALEKGGGEGEAAQLVDELTAGANGRREDFGALLAWRARARLEAKRGEWARAAEAWEQLARMAGSPAWSNAYLRRAAELWDARVNDTARAEVLYARLHMAAPADASVAMVLARLRILRGAATDAAQVLETTGRARGPAGAAQVALAARASEMDGESADTTIERWREAAEASGQRGALEALARAYRRAHDQAAMQHTYERLGTAPNVDARRGATYFAIAGALALEAEDAEAAEAAFTAAADRDPDDLLVHAGRVMLYRKYQKYNELAVALKAIIGLVKSTQAQGRLHRQLARVAGEHLGDQKTAHEHYEKALELQPDDVTTLHAFARLLGDAGKWAKAVELREHAAKSAAGARAAALLCEIGDIYEKRLSDDDSARRSYERALERDDKSGGALSALAVLHRRHKRLPELLEVLRKELKLAPDKDRQLELHLEMAKAADQAEGGDLKAALGAYRDALRMDPANAAALSGLERLCRREGNWDVLAEALKRAPRSVRTVRALCEALEHLERWEELGESKEAELALLDEPKEIARAARALADLYERRLNDPDSAARAWHRVDEADPRDPQAARALERIYESRGRFADLAAAIERELQLEAQLEPARRLELWLKLGEIRKSRLSRAESAAEAFENALRVDGQHVDALASLAELYALLKRTDDLNRVLDLRAQATTDPQQRASVLLQKGDLLERSGDLDGSLASYTESFRLDPTSRTCFTAFERVCYRKEKWRQAMELYDTAIRLVEVQRSRAYRLADLYARRGQLQLQYLGQPGEAAASYLRVLELDPEADTAQTALERIFSAQSDWPGLIGAYERRAELVRDDTKRVEILRRAARVAAAKLKDAVEAARLYQRLHSVDPTDSEGLDALERHYERTRDWEKLVGILTTRLSLTAGGDEAIALYLRIAQMCEEGLRDADRAIESYRKILDIAPSHKEAIEALGRLYEGTERWAELVEVTRRQIRIVNDRAQKAILYFKCGSVMESKFGKEDDAIRYYDAAIKTSPSCLPAVHGLRDLYLRKEDWPRVIQTLELEAKLWTEDKERAGVFAHIGQIYGDKLGDQERAIQYYESALTVDRECLPANRALFELYFAREEFQRALPIAVILTQKVTREGDPVERSEFYRKRAVVAEKTGDLRAAAESLVVALEIRPENQDALEILVGLCQQAPEAYDFIATFRELEKLYRKRDTGNSLARVLVAQGSLRERDYEIESAEQIYLEALRLSADEYSVVEAIVALHERLRRFDAAAVVLEAFIGRTKSQANRSSARYRLAEIYGDGAMDPARAAITLEELIEEDSEHRDAHFRLAQELYLLGRYGEAHRSCERLIQLAAAPGRTVPPEELARYYDYLGRIGEASGDAAGAGRAYRRAIDLDPSYPPSALSLARRAAAAGDRGQAQNIIDEALKVAETRGPEVELILRRGMARFFVAIDDGPRAIDAYRQVLARAPESHDDRVAAAELLATNDNTLNLAREELLLVLGSDLRHAPAYRLLVSVYQRSGDLDRAARVGTMLSLLGYAEATDRPPTFRASIKRGSLSDDLRRTRLLPPPVLGAYTEALAAVRETLDEVYGVPAVHNAIPAAAVQDPGFKVCVVDAQRLFGVSAEVYVAQQVPGGVIMFDSPKPTVVIESTFVDRPDGERRFLLGRAFEPLRGGYALVTRLRAAQRAEVGHLLDQLIKPESEREAQVQDFVRALPRKAAKAVERLQGLAPGASIDGWFAALGQAADRAGLLACDDVGAAARMLARLGGEELAVSQDGAVALGQVVGGAELVRFFLSDAYHDLRSTLGDPTGRL
ncbi:MAG: repeat-containing protein [Myxococcales bacterium]|nr:repeat-containing protein [Myxococcales bacterium]